MVDLILARFVKNVKLRKTKRFVEKYYEDPIKNTLLKEKEQQGKMLNLEFIKNNCVSEAREAIENGADVNVKDKRGWTALRLAEEKGYVDMIILLPLPD